MHRLLPPVAVFFVFLVCALISRLIPLPAWIGTGTDLAGAAISAFVTALVLRRPEVLPHAAASEAPKPATESATAEISPKLRHDLRGIISPAVLCADQLSMHQDELVRNRAEQILEALDRATDRLKATNG